MQIILRDYHITDKKYLALLFYQIQQKEFSWIDKNTLSLTDFEHSTEGERIFVAEVNGKIAGFISVWTPDKFIHNLFVVKNFRHLHIGQALIEKVLLTFGKPLTLKCIAQNKTALQFYLSHGWIIQEDGICDEGTYYLMILE